MTRIINGTTEGWSPKAIWAFFLPLTTAIGAALVSWIATGNWNEAETRTAIAGAVAAMLGGVGAATGNTGTITGGTVEEDHSDVRVVAE